MPRQEMLGVPSRLCGLHAQLMSSAELTVWARVEELEPTAVADALWEERSLVKVWAMRGTLHLLPAAEFGLWQAALGTYGHYLKPSWLRAFGVTREELEKLLDAVARALDGQLLTRQELAAAVAELTGSPELGEKVLGSWGPLLKPACFRGLLCFGPSAGQNVRFTRPDRWLADVPPPLDPDQATLEVARRFLAAHGPATRDDYARWWAMTPAQAMRILKRLGEEVVPVHVDGSQAWMLAAHVDEAVRATPVRSVRLLPAFDQFVVTATRHARHLLPGPFENRIYRPQGWLSPVVLVDGRMDGVWRHERKGTRLAVTVEPFLDFPTKVRRGVEQEADRLAAFLGGGLELAWG
ncbi:MAG: winged helix DNA-binding domain-containing protein [Actinomycetota bacterium]|nr:winged helix DNA-binding domain-containing protein [Actinomycetota bacterium]